MNIHRRVRVGVLLAALLAAGVVYAAGVTTAYKYDERSARGSHWFA
jgi:hypothetical protein